MAVWKSYFLAGRKALSDEVWIGSAFLAEYRVWKMLALRLDDPFLSLWAVSRFRSLPSTLLVYGSLASLPASFLTPRLGDLVLVFIITLL